MRSRRARATSASARTSSVGKAQGFDRDLILTNEEARDIVLRQPDSWHQPAVSRSTEPGAEQAGVAVAYDVKSGAYKSIYSMGRSTTRTSVGVPGYGHPVVLSGDDTFDAPGSQLYLYIAASGDGVWNDQGTLYAFVVRHPGGQRLRRPHARRAVVTATSSRFPRRSRRARSDGHEVTSADFGYPAPPSAAIPNGPQWVLEYWSQNVAHAFQFIRDRGPRLRPDEPARSSTSPTPASRARSRTPRRASSSVTRRAAGRT